jgi:hypothetical protein
MKLTLKTVEIDAIDVNEQAFEISKIIGGGCVSFCTRVGDTLICDEKVCDGGRVY